MCRLEYHIPERWNLIVWCPIYVVIFLANVCLGEYCTRNGGYHHKEEFTIQCKHGCCGTELDRYCCSELPVGLIIAIVIGCFLIVFFIIAVICYYKIRRKRLASSENTSDLRHHYHNTTSSMNSSFTGDGQHSIHCPPYIANDANQGCLYTISQEGYYNDPPPAYEDVVK